jgi:hypothetical protein
MNRPYRWLALLPTMGLLGGAFIANRVRPYIFELPFLLAWIVGWVVLTSAIMGLIYLADTAADAKDAAGQPRDAATGSGRPG